VAAPIAGGRADGERSGVDEWGGDSLKSMSASRGKYFRERRIRKNAEALAVRMDMAEHNCSAKQFLESWLKVALRGYMAKHGPGLTPAQQAAWHAKNDGPNAEALAVRQGKQQAERNRAVKDFVAALRKWAKKFAQEHGGIIMYEDIDAFIWSFRKCSAARKGGAGPDPPRKAKGKRR